MNKTPQKNYSGRFKRQVGLSPREYITHHRIGAAKLLLMDKRLKILSLGDIGYAVGYERLHSFSMTFKNKTAKWPGEWREGYLMDGEN
ncbi:MAG TPA: helix-turn-helix domain-containing protein [Balneolaceae bacterium]|nr:helix-turn-helix domain-containing protein [Balneolaceae bacterium]